MNGKIGPVVRRARKIAVMALLTALLFLFGARLSSAEEMPALENVVCEGAHMYTCSYRGAKRQFSVYEPAQGTKGILVMLHGYGSTGEDFRLLTKMDGPANARGYAVIFPTGVPSPEDPTSSNGWNSGIGVSSSDDIGFLRALARYWQTAYGLSRGETFAAGFSNGGFMMYRIALEGQDEFAAVAGVAAMMPERLWQARPDRVHISVLQVNGTKDDAVPMKLNGSDRYAKAPAIEDVIDYFAAANGLGSMTEEQLSPGAVLTKYSSEASGERVWRVLISEGRHSWAEERYCGFDLDALVLDFLDGV